MWLPDQRAVEKVGLSLRFTPDEWPSLDRGRIRLIKTFVGPQLRRGGRESVAMSSRAQCLAGSWVCMAVHQGKGQSDTRLGSWTLTASHVLWIAVTIGGKDWDECARSETMGMDV